MVSIQYASKVASLRRLAFDFSEIPDDDTCEKIIRFAENIQAQRGSNSRRVCHYSRKETGLPWGLTVGKRVVAKPGKKGKFVHQGAFKSCSVGIDLLEFKRVAVLKSSLGLAGGLQRAEQTKLLRDCWREVGIARQLESRDGEHRVLSAMQYRGSKSKVAIERFETIAPLASGNITDLSAQLHQDHRPNISKIIEVCLSLLSEVEMMHAEGLAHCDIKPDNFLYHMGADRTLMKTELIDFGFSNRFKNQAPERYMFCGTPGFTAPEIFTSLVKKQPVFYNLFCAQKTDIYSLGLTMYVLMTGKMHPLSEKTKAFKDKYDKMAISAMFSDYCERKLQEALIIQDRYIRNCGCPTTQRALLLIAAMCSLDPRKRPHLSEIRAELESLLLPPSHHLDTIQEEGEEEVGFCRLFCQWA